MAPPTIPLESHKDRIRILFLEDKKSVVQIAQELSEELGVPIKVRTLQRRLQDWGFHRQTRTQKTEELREDLKKQFYQESARNDTKLTRNLSLEGHQVSRTGVVQLRRELVGKIRLEADEFPEADAKAHEIVGVELQKGGSEYGRELWRTNIRKKGHNIARLYNLLT